MKKIVLAGMLVTLLATLVDAAPRSRRARRRAVRRVTYVQSNTVRSYSNYAQIPWASSAEKPAVAVPAAPVHTYVAPQRVTTLKPVVGASLLSTEKAKPMVVAVANAPNDAVADLTPTVTDSTVAREEVIPTVSSAAAPLTVVSAPIEMQPSASPAPVPANSAMAEMNSIRARRGLPALIEDPSLSVVAYQKALIQAQRCAVYHPGGSMGGARFEGVGMGPQFATCYLYATHATYAGAATVTGANGQRYHCLLLR